MSAGFPLHCRSRATGVKGFSLTTLPLKLQIPLPDACFLNLINIAQLCNKSWGLEDGFSVEGPPGHHREVRVLLQNSVLISVECPVASESVQAPRNCPGLLPSCHKFFHGSVLSYYRKLKPPDISCFSLQKKKNWGEITLEEFRFKSFYSRYTQRVCCPSLWCLLLY